MLYILTGNSQTGKTRWLQALLANLQEAGVLVNGVIAPGQWVDHGQDANPRYEKLGIDNVLLPQGETLIFARRKDLATEGESCSQAQAAKLGWAISDSAIDRVNAHFDLPEALDGAPGLLVIDELGPLELLKGGGLISAMKVLEQGPSAWGVHALVVIRESLVELAAQRFGACWGQACIIRATAEAAAEIKALFSDK